MNLELPSAASELARAASRAMVQAGGVGLARRAERDPDLRSGEAVTVLGALGVDDLDVRAGEEAAYAGAELCRAAGYFAFPFPVASLLAVPRDRPWRFAALIDAPEVGRHHAWADHGDLEGPWVAVDPGGRAWNARQVARPRNPTLAPFVRRMELGPLQGMVTDVDRCWLMNLVSWQVLGAVEAAHSLAVQHVTSREQFGRLLAKFQGVQFHVADAEVTVRGLRQLARFTVWRLMTRPEGAVPDAYALRSVALGAARVVLNVSQLLHGATGFCDEHELSTIVRAVQAPLRLPTDFERTNDLLAVAIDRYGFESLFDDWHASVVDGGPLPDDQQCAKGDGHRGVDRRRGKVGARAETDRPTSELAAHRGPDA